MLTRTSNSDSIIHNNIAGTISSAFNDLFPGDPATRLEDQMAKMERIKAVAEVHPYAISFNEKRQRWVTTYRDAEKKRHIVEAKDKAALAEKLYVIYEIEKTKRCISDIYAEWREERMSTDEVTTATLDRMHQDWKRFFVKYGWDQKRIRDIKPRDLEFYIKSTISAEKLSSKGYSHFKGLLYEILRRAHRDGDTDISPRIFFDDLGRIKTRRVIKKDDEQVFTDEELDKVLSYLRENPDTLNRALLLDFLTGLRVGELCALKKEDFSGRYLHVRRTETKQKGNGRDGGSTIVQEWTKTDAGDRMVYLTDEAVSVITQLLVDPRAVDSEWLLIGMHGNRVIRSTIRRRLEVVCKKCDIPAKSPHKIRKTYATHLIDAGVDENIIKDQMGHTDIQTTKDYYYFTHQTDEVKRNQLEAVRLGA